MWKYKRKAHSNKEVQFNTRFCCVAVWRWRRTSSVLCRMPNSAFSSAISWRVFLYTMFLPRILATYLLNCKQHKNNEQQIKNHERHSGSSLDAESSWKRKSVTNKLHQVRSEHVKVLCYNNSQQGTRRNIQTGINIRLTHTHRFLSVGLPYIFYAQWL